MKYNNIELKWLGHSSFMIKYAGKFFYIDPYKILGEDYEVEKADYVFITHSHYDHCSIEDIKKIYKASTVIICTADCQSKMRHVSESAKVTLVAPSDKFQFENGKILVWTVPAYNTNKPVHSREEDWVGYILNFDGTQVYHAGDTDFIPEMKRMAGLDIALLPIGGNYTMNGGEAATAAKFINPKIAIPMHYGSISGSGEDVKAFTKFCSGEGIETKVLEREEATSFAEEI